MKLFFSKYGVNLYTGIRLYDNEKNEFTLRKDESGGWLEQTFILHVQAKMLNTEKLVQENRKFDYYLPLLKNNEQSGIWLLRLIIRNTLKMFLRFLILKNYQWQWVISNSGEIVYDNYGEKIQYSKLDLITKGLQKDLWQILYTLLP